MVGKNTMHLGVSNVKESSPTVRPFVQVVRDFDFAQAGIIPWIAVRDRK
jgi:hypothetical protein